MLSGPQQKMSMSRGGPVTGGQVSHQLLATSIVYMGCCHMSALIILAVELVGSDLMGACQHQSSWQSRPLQGVCVVAAVEYH